ncbi:MAG: (d)CMP kinase [Saprospirales bacterium]|nr:(d)CMP kinase [Saprospirales bacterium]MBK6904110.1 (d)CMP kinase [Saprospirales bacterium]
MEKKIIVAIDGHSSCGKSTLARDLARGLSYAYIDSGAMYRAVTLYFLENGVDWNDPSTVGQALQRIRIEFQVSEAQNQTLLNGVIVEDAIRSMRVSEYVSPVSTISAVRRAMVAQQQDLGRKRGVVMDGRDIGTVVFPDAELKIFLTASTEERVRRRYSELSAKGIHITEEEVRANLLDRDRIDSTREDSPLKQASDARILDNTFLSREEQYSMVMKWALEAIRS